MLAIKRLILVGFFLMFSACQASSVEKSGIVDTVESDLVVYLFSIYDDFQITEIFSKNDNKKNFLKLSLSEEFLADSSHVDSKELYFKRVAGKLESHIGIASVLYTSVQAAKKASETLDNDGYFSNTKILTKYIIVNVGNENLIVYSESAADKVVTLFIERLLKMKLNGVNHETD